MPTGPCGPGDPASPLEPYIQKKGLRGIFDCSNKINNNLPSLLHPTFSPSGPAGPGNPTEPAGP